MILQNKALSFVFINTTFIIANKKTGCTLTDTILFALKHHPVVFVNGPRQAGKSTLAQHLHNKDFPGHYVSFDNVTQMAAAASSPESFLKNRKEAMIIDEVEMVPELLRALKLVVDGIRLEISLL